jgi:hypothetical protein
MAAPARRSSVRYMATTTAPTALDILLPLRGQSTLLRAIVWATPEQTRAAIWEADLLATPLARALTSAAMCPERIGAWMRHEPQPETRPRSARLHDMLSGDSPWTLLSEEPVALGLLWTPPAGGVKRPADEFAAFDEPGFAKVVWTLEVAAFGAGHALLTTETGTETTDERATRRLALMWPLISPFALLLRRQVVRAIKAEAESRAHDPGTR